MKNAHLRNDLLKAITAVIAGSLFLAGSPGAIAIGGHSSVHGSSGGGHSSGGHSSHSGGGYHSGSYHSGGYHNGYGRGYGNGGIYDDGQEHYYDEGHPVQTGAVFSGPAHIDPQQYHYFVQEYSWPTRGASATSQDYHWPARTTATMQEPRNAAGTAYGVQSEPRVSGLLNK